MTQAFLPPELGMKLDEAKLWTAILSYAGEPIRLGTANASLTFELAERPAPAGAALNVEGADSAKALISLTSFPFKALFNSDLQPAELFDLPDGLRGAILEGIVAMIAGALPAHRAGALRLAGTGSVGGLSDRPEMKRLRWFAVSLRGLAPEPITFDFGVDPVVLGRALGSGSFAARAAWSDLKTRLTAEVSLALGAIDLPVVEARALRPGDFVVLAETVGRTAVLHAGDLAIDLKAENGRWTVVARRTERRWRAETRSGASRMSDQPTAGGLTVALDFDLGRTTVPIADLESWQPGAIVALDLPAPKEGIEITVRANGEVIGTGDLVRLDDRVAVRLTRLNLSR